MTPTVYTKNSKGEILKKGVKIDKQKILDDLNDRQNLISAIDEAIKLLQESYMRNGPNKSEK